MLELVGHLALVAAAMTMGLAAGLLFTFAHTVMPGLGRTDDRTFVAAFRAIDRAVDNVWMGLTFIGAPALTVLAAVLHRDASALRWILGAVLLYAAAMGVTVAVHLPLNRQIHLTGPSDGIPHLSAIRDRLRARWRRWNAVRTATLVGAFGLLCMALLASPLS